MLDTFDGWQASSRTFEEDMELEFRDAALLFVEVYAEKTSRLHAGNFSALINAPISASVREDLVHIATTLKADIRSIPAFFASVHFREVRMQQLSARLYSAFKKRLRRKADQLPSSREASSHQQQFGDWLAGLTVGMTPQDAQDLTWAYPRYRQEARAATCNTTARKPLIW